MKTPNKPARFASAKVIFTWFPADRWGKIGSCDSDSSKQRARNVPVPSADVFACRAWEGRLYDDRRAYVEGYKKLSFSYIEPGLPPMSACRTRCTLSKIVADWLSVWLCLPLLPFLCLIPDCISPSLLYFEGINFSSAVSSRFKLLVPWSNTKTFCLASICDWS